MEQTTSLIQRSLARLLRPFAKVEPSEAVTAVVLTSTVFLLLTAYYLLKTAREPLILLGGGAEVKSYAAGGQALLLLVFIRAYGSVAKRVGRMKLLAVVYLFFVSNLFIFAALSAANVAIGVPFYLWVGVFNYTSIAQFWAFAADVYTPEQGKRLFAILGIGSSVGAVVGARIARALVSGGPQMLMLTATALLLICVALIAWVDRRSRENRGQAGPSSAPEEPLAESSAVRVLARDKYLLLIAALTLVLNWVNSNGEYLLDRTLLESLPVGQSDQAVAAFIGRFKADYFSWVNIVGVLLQLFAVSRILSRLGVRAALYFLPAVAFAGYGALIAAPALAIIRLSKIAENSLDYSIQNTARQALYLVATREEKFIGKTAVDSFFVRFGDVLSAGLVWVGAQLALPAPAFAAINLALIGIWLLILTVLGREHRRRSEPLANAPATAPKLAVGMLAIALPLLAGGSALAENTSQKRELPNYEGREDEPATPGDVALWVPRGALAPIYLVAEYGLRRPLGTLIADAERAHLPETLYNFFFFGPDHKAGFAPVAFYDFGFNPSFGLYAFWDDALFKGHDLHFHGSTFGSDWLAGNLTESFRFADTALALSLRGIRRPDHAFFGLGSGSLQSNISRYGEDLLEASAQAELAFWRASRIEAGFGVKSVRFYHGHYRGDPSVEQFAATGVYPVPFGFDRGYTAPTVRVLAAVDTRLPRPSPGSGVRIQAEAEQGMDLLHTPASGWIRYGGSAGAFLDLNGRNRVLSLSVVTRFADPLGPDPVPFTELVSLGGEDYMHGFLPGRLIDRSAALATARYRWPVWVWLDGSLEASVGNVFGAHLDGFQPSRFRVAGAIGVESSGGRDGSFEIVVGAGTETFDQGAKIDSVRIVIGANRAF